MKWIIRRFPLALLTLLSVNWVLYALFWGASAHLSFGFAGHTEEASFELNSQTTNSPFEGNFWQSYGKWLGLIRGESTRESFPALGIPQSRTSYNARKLPSSQSWRILREETDGDIKLYESANFPIKDGISTLPPAHTIKQWRWVKNVQIRDQKGTWQVSELGYNGILQGNWGTSLSFSRPVVDLIASRLPLTFLLGLLSVGLAYGLALPFAYLLAGSQNQLSKALKSFGLLFFSAPHVILGLCLLWLFSWQLKWLPLQTLPWWEFSTSPLKGFLSLLAPALALSLPVLVTNSLLIAQRIEEERGKDYVLFARAKGLSEVKISLAHLIKPTLSPLVVRIKNILLLLVSGSLVVENLFGVAGVGQLSLEALLNNDLTLALALANLIAFIQITGQFISEGVLALWYEKNPS